MRVEAIGERRRTRIVDTPQRRDHVASAGKEERPRQRREILAALELGRARRADTRFAAREEDERAAHPQPEYLEQLKLAIVAASAARPARETNLREHRIGRIENRMRRDVHDRAGAQGITQYALRRIDASIGDRIR